MKSDAQLKRDVEAELEWDASINATHVGVTVQDGVVTLTGHLDTFAEKHLVERAVQRVEGVRALAVELDVRLCSGHVRSDSDIAHAIETAFEWNAMVPAERVQVKVEKGWVTLRGELDWDFQRRNAAEAVRSLIGVKGITNLLSLKTRTTPANISARIREALKRQAEREANGIEVTVTDSTARLQGQVHSWSERTAVQGAAFSAPGISRVINELHVTR
jgi:osmotically-inducible protein OsmY